MVFASVPVGDLVWTLGADKVKSFKSSGFGHRRYCGRCGTPFLMEVDHQPETVDFSVATLDEPDCVEPGFHIFWSSRIAWFEPRDALPKHERFRPDTPGRYGVRGIPTMLLFKNGEAVAQKVGAAPRSQIQQWLEAEL